MEARRRRPILTLPGVATAAAPRRDWKGLEEPDLIRHARKESEAFGELYRRHYGAIARYLYRRTGNRDTTEDLLSDVFLAALRGLPRYRYRGIPFRFWLYRIATRSANRWARRARRALAQIEDVGLLPDPTPERAPQSDGVFAQLLRLPPRHQAVLTLHYVEGLAIEEVARALGTRPGTVKSRLHRARALLRGRLEGGRNA